MSADVIAEEYGYDDPMDAVQGEGWAFDSVVPGCCIECKMVISSCEPDARENWCPECGKGTVKSILVLLGIV